MASRLQDVLLRGVAASRPAAADVAIGTLYYSTDSEVIEQSNGTSWDAYSGSGGGGGLDQLTGDVTAGPGTGSQVATIANDAVTYAKMQAASAASVAIGRGEGSGAGDLQELTFGLGMSLSGTIIRATAVASGVFNYTFGTATTAPPNNAALRLNAAHPYTAVTAVYADFDSTTGMDLYWGWMQIKTGSTLFIQDKDTHTMYVELLVTGSPIDQGTYVELPVTWVANGTALAAQDILIRVRGTGIPVAHAASHEDGGTDEIDITALGGFPGGTSDFLRADGSFAAPPAASTAIKTRTIGITVDGGGAVVTTGAKGFRSFPVAGTITGARLIANASGSVIFDVKKSTYSAFPTQSSIVASAPPTLSSAQKNEDTTLTGWTTAVSAGDIFGFEITGTPATITRVTLELTIVVT